MYVKVSGSRHNLGVCVSECVCYLVTLVAPCFLLTITKEREREREREKEDDFLLVSTNASFTVEFYISKVRI